MDQRGHRGRDDLSTRRWIWPTGIGLAAVALFFTYLRLPNTLPEDSDQANLGLQAWDMLHGNLLLHGWSLSDTSFYTTELPQYMLLELILGLNTGIFHAAAAMTYTLALLLAAPLAKGTATRREAYTASQLTAGAVACGLAGCADRARIGDRGLSSALPDRDPGLRLAGAAPAQPGPGTRRSWCSVMRSRCSGARSPGPSQTGPTARSWQH